MFNRLRKKFVRKGDEKLSYSLIFVIRFVLILAILIETYEQRWTIVFVSLLTFILTFIPHFLERKYDIDIPPEFEIVMVLFIYGSIFLGEVHEYYTRYYWWDAILHAGSALVLGFIGFLILYVLYRTGKFKASFRVLAFFAFCFALALGAFWEIFEFFMDSVFGLNMQKNGIVDTMWDLIVNAIGAGIASISGYVYLKKKESFILSKLLKRFEKRNPKLFK